MAPSATHAELSSKHRMDTGYSWLVLAASFFISAITIGQVLNFGIYFVVFLDYFGSSRKATSLVGALCYALMCLIGPVAGVLQKRYGARVVITTGALLGTLGMILSYFATELWHLYVSNGLLCGVGYGLCITPSLGVLPEYFDKHRYFVTTFVSVGAALGCWIMAPLNLFLIETYTWRGSMLIQAGFFLQMVVFGVICKSRILHLRVRMRSLFDMAIFKDHRFVLLLLDGVALGGASFTIFSMINSLIIGRGLTTWQSAQLVSIAGLSNTGARILVSVISHLECTDRTLLYCVMSLTTAAGITACVFGNDFWTFAAALMVFGFSLGAKFSQPPNVIIDLFGVDKVVTGIGYFMFSIGFGGLVLPLLAGWLADRTDTKYAFIMTATNCMVGFGFCCLLLFSRCRTNANRMPVEDQHMPDVRNLDRTISVD